MPFNLLSFLDCERSLTQFGDLPIVRRLYLGWTAPFLRLLTPYIVKTGSGMFRKKQTWIVVIAVVSAVAGGLAYRHHHRYKHLAIHEPGMVYRSAWVEPDVMSELIETYQFRSVINLCNPGEMGEQRWAEERDAVINAGARLIELPMFNTVDVSDSQIAKHIEVLGDPDNYPMLVHCQHGVTRTAKLLAIYDIVYRGQSAEETLRLQPLFGRDDHNVNVRAFVKEFSKKHQELYPHATADKLKVLR